MNVGFLYIIYKNFDKEQDELLFFNEALCSIKSLRSFTKLPIYIKTDYPNFFEHQGIENLFIEAFTRTPDLEYRTHQKLLSLKDLPFGLTFFVDSDTLFLSNPEVLISRDFDLQICREVCWKAYQKEKSPTLLRGFNSGFFIAKNTNKYHSLIAKAIDILQNPQSYSRLFDIPHFQGDQWYLNQALLRVFDLDIKILQPHWNIRPPLFSLINTALKNPKLLHARGGELTEGIKLIKSNLFVDS